MPRVSVEKRPDWSFQEDAIERIASDFSKKFDSKNLLVIPTGGGKTFTALRAVNRMIQMGTLRGRVLWAVHRTQLKKQAIDDLDDLMNKENRVRFDIETKLKKIVDVQMIKAAAKILNEDKDGKYKLLIIDEAHHSAANSYKDFFRKPIGILGLTATPTRNDDSELEFEKISYSITFRDLIKRNVVLEPSFERVETGRTIGVTTLDFERFGGELDKQFNIDSRNRFIAEEIFRRRSYYQKVIVFVGTNKHALDLFEVIKSKNEFLNKPFEHVGYIFGDNDNEQGISNEDYLAWHKKQQSSILINCQLLNEGYNDPSINAVVMAVPTRSILYYMQCVGRVVRSPGDEGGKAYVLEFDDSLPNISYRIDNKWLFSDISDYLEPSVLETDCSNHEEFIEKLNKLLKDHHVKEEYRQFIPENVELDSFSLLLMQPRSDFGERSPWVPMFFYPENRNKYTKLFNSLCDVIGKDPDRNPDVYLRKFNINVSLDEYFSKRAYKIDFFQALRKAEHEKSIKIPIKRIKYYNFFQRERLPIEFVNFIDDCHNKEILRDQMINHVVNGTADYLLKFPLLLTGYEGYYCTESVLTFCIQYINALKQIKNGVSLDLHDKALFENQALINNVPLPLKYLQSLIILCRENVDKFYYKLI